MLWGQIHHVLPLILCEAKTQTGDIIDLHNSLNFELNIILAKVKSPFFSNLEDLRALFPVESVHMLLLCLLHRNFGIESVPDPLQKKTITNSNDIWIIVVQSF